MNVFKLDDVEFFYRMRQIVGKYPKFHLTHPLAYKRCLARIQGMQETTDLIKGMSRVLDILGLGPYN